MIVATIGYTPSATAKYRITVPLTDSVLQPVPTEPPVVLAKGGKRPQAQFKQAAKSPAKRTKPVATLKKPIGPRSKKRSVSAMPKATLPTGRLSVSQAAGKNVNERIKNSSQTLGKARSITKTIEATRKTLRQTKLLPSPQKLGHTPYAAGRIRSFVTQKTETYYRVYSGDKTTGGFLTKSRPKSREWAQQALTLPPSNKATKIQKVIVPAGTRLIRSRALGAFGRRGGAEQFLLLDKIPRGNFKNGKEFR
ncbi:hypothetical protein [Sulfitobacter sp. HI0076]|nr:hypothetical protein [Sulfitobacter sp. HI0076]